jgi:hypothetical protein
MSLLQKVLLGTLLLLAVFAGGYWAGRGDKQVEIREVKVKGDVVEKIVERVVEKIRTVKPDGTVEEKEITRDITKDKKEKIVSNDKASKVTPYLPKWGVGGGAVVGVDTFPEVGYYVNGRYKVIGSIWVESSINTNKSVSVGISVEL